MEAETTSVMGICPESGLEDLQARFVEHMKNALKPIAASVDLTMIFVAPGLVRAITRSSGCECDEDEEGPANRQFCCTPGDGGL